MQQQQRCIANKYLSQAHSKDWKDSKKACSETDNWALGGLQRVLIGRGCTVYEVAAEPLKVGDSSPGETLNEANTGAKDLRLQINANHAKNH